MKTEENKQNIFCPRPFIEEKIWGSTELGKLFGVNSHNKIGEIFALSTLKGKEGEVEGKNLSALVGKLSYLVKWIKTTDNLSIQVHPDDEYALKNENSSGKAECWFILDASDGAGIYLGLRDGVQKSELKKALEEKREDLSDFLHFFPVKKGDFFSIPPGAIHAIGKGVFLLEVQQSSGITYRVWDWNRQDSDGSFRVLHVDKALDVIRFDEGFNKKDCFKLKSGLFSEEGVIELIRHKDFVVHFCQLQECEVLNLKKILKNSKGPIGVVGVSGKWELSIGKRCELVLPYQSLCLLYENNVQEEETRLKNRESGIVLFISSFL